MTVLRSDGYGGSRERKGRESVDKEENIDENLEVVKEEDGLVVWSKEINWFCLSYGSKWCPKNDR
jgi:hypothetical protein